MSGRAGFAGVSVGTTVCPVDSPVVRMTVGTGALWQMRMPDSATGAPCRPSPSSGRAA